ncbi:hypothetical protein [Nocardioides campestrisoli]|uniref:hypothetical protein n=1 Tax=Nocardioides campestrisoli TaxID=2736757 RepID=UPI0015E67FDD|nr:hypothetical protein [Nocardioides campestrisoli]
MSAARVLGVAAVLVAGTLAGLAGALVHGRWWGLALACAALLAVLAALGPTLARAGFAAGWGVGIGLALYPRPEGDYLIAASAQGYLLLATVLVAAGWVVLTLPRRRARRDPFHSRLADRDEVGRSS